MRWMVHGAAVVLALGCKKDATKQPPGATHGSGSGVAAVVAAADAGTVAALADAAAPVSAPIELLHAVPATIRVSSQVRNKTILPRHIADGILQTAWNSRTGEMVGSWIDVTVEGGAQIGELRMTNGHTGKGPRGQDYYAMNPRITKLKVLADGKPEQVVTLDANTRALQTIPVGGAPHVRLVVAEVIPGSKKTWREAAVSELEAWGTPPTGWSTPASRRTPLVLVGEPDPDPEADDPCADLEDAKAARQAQREADDAKCAELPTQQERDQCMVDPPGDPGCATDSVKIEKLGPPWEEATVSCDIYDDIYGPTTCTLTAYANGGHATVADLEMDSPQQQIEIDEAVMADVLPGGASELVVRYRKGDEADTSTLVVCRAEPAVSCSAPIALADVDWTAKVAFKSGAAVLTTGTGTPPADALGTKPLVFK